MEKRKSFFSEEQFPHQTKTERLNSVAALFRQYHLHDYRYELGQWLYMALANNMGAYVDVVDKEALIDFVESLQKLIESLYIIQLHEENYNNKTKTPKISKEVREMLVQVNEPNLLDSFEKEQPVAVVVAFCKKYKKSYVRAELLDLLNAVVTYKGSRTVFKGGMVHFYYCLFIMVNMVYKWGK